MNAAEFNTEIAKTINRAFNEGVMQSKFDVPTLVGILELQKLDVVRFAQDQARAATMPKIQPATILPPGRNGN